MELIHKTDLRLISYKRSSCTCNICGGTSYVLVRNEFTWEELVILIFKGLRSLYPTRRYFSLQKIVYIYVMLHWNVFGNFEQFVGPTQKWETEMKLTLMKSIYFKEKKLNRMPTGYWCLKESKVGPNFFQKRYKNKSVGNGTF